MRKLLLITATAIWLAGCGNDGTVTFTDERDGKAYKTVKIGYQTWMAENLNYQTSKGSWCFGNADSNCVKYGRLYDWEAAKTACPAGWHLPFREEWDDLAYAAGGEISRQKRPGKSDDINWLGAGKTLKAKNGWESYNVRCKEGSDEICKVNGNGTDDHGFSALPGGYGSCHGCFHDYGSTGFWWAAVNGDSVSAYYRYMSRSGDAVDERDFNKVYLASVRCLRDGYSNGGGTAADLAGWRKEEAEKRKAEKERIEKLSDYFTDSRDGRKYRTVRIGGTAWMAENLNYETSDSSWCYNDDTAYCNVYGRLYDWKTALTICPLGWHLPTRGEWYDLIVATGGEDASAKKLKAKSGWDDDGDQNSNGTDDYGFSALPGGKRYSGDGFSQYNRFAMNGTSGDLWTASEASEYDSATAYYLSMYFRNDDAGYAGYNKTDGISVRCVADN